MKKYLLLALSTFFGVGVINAKPVSVSLAQTVASNFYTQNTNAPVSKITLAYTETNTNGNALFYVFNINSSFVIVSAEDALLPVIGYSTEGGYVAPKPGSNFYYWMQGFSAHINYLIAQHAKASPQVSEEWYNYQNNIKPNTHKAHTAVAPLCKTTWDQPYPYNAMCPGGSVTGCVATAMAQIMKYWNYPAHGIGSSFYTETSPENYGLLTANYDTSIYRWINMPNNVTTTNHPVAQLMYDCGVSVDMGYSPSESGAWVITADNKICAQSSYVNYFGYDATTIQGLKRKNYSDSAWMGMIENELNNNRVIQYAGWDTVYGGHTWVCDGYDVNNKLHMNWGWSGSDNGYFALDTFNAKPYFFCRSHEIVIGIQPPPVLAEFDATPKQGCAGITVNFTDKSLVPDAGSPITSWAWTFAGGSPSTSTVQNPSVVYNTPGTYAVTLIVINKNGTDTLKKTSYISISGPNALPLTQNFEGAFPPAQWSVNNPWLHPSSWSQYSGTGGYGSSTHCMYFNNCQYGKSGQYDQVYTNVYDFSAVSNPLIYFDVAYAPYNSQYSDTLALYYSLDCGNTFTRVYLKGGMDLCTTGGVTVLQGANSDMNGCFLPLSNNWRTDSVTIPGIAGQSNVMFSFENRSGNGSSIYIDNINVPLPTGMNNITENTSLKVYPNPSTGNFNISFNTLPGTVYEISVYNVLGQSVVNKTIKDNSGELVYPVSLSSFGKGVYSVVLKYGNKESVQKVAIF